MDSISNLDLRSHTFLSAVTSVQKRAEQQIDIDRLIETLVESDLSIRVEAVDTQLVLGRRGTGKTHLIRAFQHRYQLLGKTVFYEDCRRLASNYSENDPTVSAKKYFGVLLNSIGSFLHDQAMQLEWPIPEVADKIHNSLIYGLTPYMEANRESGVSSFNYRQINETISNVIDYLDMDRLYIILDEWSSIPANVQPHVAEYIKRSLLMGN